MSTVAVSARVLIGAMFASALLALHGCGDQSSERIGGGGMPDLVAGAGQMPEAGSSGEGGAAGNAPVAWCAAYKIINCVCQQCHQNPPVNSAPIPLMTYADTQAPLPASSKTNFVWMTALGYVSNGFMPFTGDPNVMPPVKPLTEEEKTTLVTWLKQGAHDEGGTDCHPTCDWSDGTPGL